MNNEIIEKKTQSVDDLKTQIILIQKALKEIMKKDVHYGTIPGCKKPCLYKPGAEYLLSLFRIAIEPEPQDLSTDDCIRYRVICRGKYIPTGLSLGAAIGECSSNEEKYKWRAAICKEEFDETPENRKRYKYQKDFRTQAIKQIPQVRTEPSDIANTILKMATKRAMVAFCLNITSASDVFDQDIEDLPDYFKNNDEKNTPIKPAMPTMISNPGNENNTPGIPANSSLISTAQAKRLYAIAMKKMSEEELKKYLKNNYNIESTKDIKKEWYDDICNWAE
ncbi:MAG: hypothetical protein ACFFE4_00370 [Candidatus Thorarchaeota archaeon]